MALERLLRTGKTFVIAEIGTAHRGDRQRALDLVDAAAEAGADCVKTQIVYADEIVHRKTGLVELPGGAVPLWDRFRELEADPQLFADMAEGCRRRGITFLASCFGPRSLKDLVDIGADAVKIASPELNHLPLLKMVRDAGLDLFLSTGVSTLGDIEAALVAVAPRPAALLHCVTAYPAPPEDYNLRLVGALATVFGRPVGVSDHSLDPVLIPTVAAALGAVCIEKHFTLERSGGGLDDPIALEPAAFRSMVESVRGAEGSRGAQEQGPVEATGRSGREETLQTLARQFGAERLESVLGDGVKRLAPSEAQNYGRSNRSILAAADIAPGEAIGPENAAILRSEKNLTPGLRPEHWDTIQGARTTKPIRDGEGIRWEKLLG
jgi:sialic acid synthase SpsE